MIAIRSIRPWDRWNRGRRDALVAVLLAASLLSGLAPMASLAPARAAGSGAMLDLPGCKANTVTAGWVEPELDFTPRSQGVDHTTLYIQADGLVALRAWITPGERVLSEFYFSPFTSWDFHLHQWYKTTVTTFGSTVYGGRPAYCVNWTETEVEPYGNGENLFQFLLVDRGDIELGDFDVYFNYEQIEFDRGYFWDQHYVGFWNWRGDSYTMPGSGQPDYFIDSSSNALTKGSRGSTQLGRYIFEFRQSGTTTGNAAIEGTVYRESAASGNELAGAYVQVCTADGFCRVTTSNASGRYAMSGLPAGEATGRVFPPAGVNVLTGTLGPIELSDSLPISQHDVVLLPPPPPPPPPTIIIGPVVGTTTGGHPIVFWRTPITITEEGCPGGTATVRIIPKPPAPPDNIIEATMIEMPAGSGSYVVTIPELFPLHGWVTVVVVIVCPDGTVLTTSRDVYIDPSGHVRTVGGTPIPGATVTLYRSDSGLPGSFAQVPDGSAIMSPENRTNPDTTNASGHFGWDTIAGYYRVRAERPGCVAPDDADQAYVETETLIVPPEVTDIDLRLDCGLGPFLDHDRVAVQYSDPIEPVTVTTVDVAPDIPGLTASPSVAVDGGDFVSGLPAGLNLRPGLDHGTWIIDGAPLVAPGDYTIRLTVTEQGGGTGSADLTLTVLPEDATVTAAGPTIFSTAGPASGIATVSLTALVADAADGHPGDLRTATVDVVDRATGALLCSAAVGPIGPTTGAATCGWSVDLGNEASATQTVGFRISGNYTGDDPAADVSLSIVRPTAGSAAKGAAQLVNAASAGLLAGTAGEKTTLALNARIDDAGSLVGQASLTFRSGGRTYQAQTDSIGSLVTDPATGVAVVRASVSLRDVSDPRQPLAGPSEATLDIRLTDRGDPGTTDGVAITVWSHAGGLWFASAWSATGLTEQPLSGGNLTVR